YGTPAFYVAGRIFARLHEEPGVLVCWRADTDERQALLDADPEKFFTTDHYRGHAGVLVRLGRVDVDELSELLAEAWQARAPKRRRRPAGGGGRPPPRRRAVERAFGWPVPHRRLVPDQEPRHEHTRSKIHDPLGHDRCREPPPHRRDHPTPRAGTTEPDTPQPSERDALSDPAGRIASPRSLRGGRSGALRRSASPER